MKIPEPIWLQEVTSTNTILGERIKSSTIPSGTIIAAHMQTAGRGRFDRKWQSGRSANLTFSLYFSTQKVFPEIASIPMAVSLGVRKYLQKKQIIAKCKWPNDVMVNDHKICGILSEQIKMDDDRTHIVIGVGLNLNMTATELKQIDKPATSVFNECGFELSPPSVLQELIPYLCNSLNIWEGSGFEGIKTEWCKHCWRYGQDVTINNNNLPISGKLFGFGNSGEIILELADKSHRTIWSGDVQ